MEGFVEKSDYETFKLNIQKRLRAKAMKPQVGTRILTGDFELKLHHRKVQFLDPGGESRVIQLPPVTLLDGVPWLKPTRCTNCHCPTDPPCDCKTVDYKGTYLFIAPWPTDVYYHILSLADAAEDLTIKYKELLWNRQTVECPKSGELHDVPPLSGTEGEEFEVMVIGQDQGGYVFCNGIIWRGFLGGVT